MDQDITANQSVGEKMLHQESPTKDNGLVSNQESEFILEFDPLPQRKLKLNRRGFFLLDRKEDKESDTNLPRIVIQSNQNDKNKTKVTQDRLKSLSPEQKKIKLCNSAPGRQNGIKRASTDTSTNSTDPTSQESPAKKKHKPITWP